MEKSTEKKLILIRHGQTEFNIQHRLQGWCDSPLTETGKEQMKAAGRALADLGVHPEVIWSSDLGRAEQSAALVAPEAKNLVLPDLREYSFGDYDGQSGLQVPDWDELPRHGAETLQEAQQRLAQALGTVLASTEPGGTAVVITHGIASSLILALSEHEEEPEWFLNGCLLEYSWDGKDLRLERILNNERGKE